MTPRQYEKIRLLIGDDTTLRNSFITFYDKALGDGDIVISLEEAIKEQKDILKKDDLSAGDMAVRGFVLKYLKKFFN